MLCDGCGESFLFEHTGPLEPKYTALSIQECPNCRVSIIASMAGEDAYKMRKDTVDLQIAILSWFAEVGPPMTVRQVYYRMSTLGIVPKTDAGYRKVQTQLTNMRRAGTIPYYWISDNTRRVMQAKSYSGLGDALTHFQESYRRDLWASQPSYVEIWIEKDALAGQLWPIVNEFGVPLYVARGYSSLSFVYESAETLRSIDKEIFIYYLGDFDADGMYATVTLQEELRRHGARFHFERLGITPKQIDQHGLHQALRPQKRTSTRFKWWKETYGNPLACELDALHPQVLRQLVHNAITRHIDEREWTMAERIEREEKHSLQMVLSNWH